MAPPIEPFPASDLHRHINALPNGKRRKGGEIDLKKCDLMELVQYSCWAEQVVGQIGQTTKCRPVVKTFRR